MCVCIHIYNDIVLHRRHPKPDKCGAPLKTLPEPTAQTPWCSKYGFETLRLIAVLVEDEGSGLGCISYARKVWRQGLGFRV